MTIKPNNSDEKRVKIFKDLAGVKREIVRYLFHNQNKHNCGRLRLH